MRYFIFSTLFFVFITLSNISAGDDTISDSLSTYPNSEKIITKKKSIAYDLNNSIKSIFQQEINLPEMINYIYEAELGDNLEKISSKLAVSQKKNKRME